MSNTSVTRVALKALPALSGSSLTYNAVKNVYLTQGWTSAAGNFYYRGVRFCDRIVIVEKVGLFHNWTYIDSIEIYAFNGTKLELVQKRDYEKVHRNEEFIRAESEAMLKSYFEGVMKTQNVSIPSQQVEEQAKAIIDRSYKSFLESDFNTRLTQILPQIGQG